MIRSIWRLSRSFLVTHAILALAFFAFLPMILGFINLLNGNVSSDSTLSASVPSQQVEDGTASNAGSGESVGNGGNDASLALPDENNTIQSQDIERNLPAELIAGLFSAAIYLLIMGAAAQNAGFRDKDPSAYSGFVAGIIASLPALILAIMLSMEGKDVLWINVAYRLWMSPYIEIYSIYENAMPALAYVTLPFMPLTMGIFYMRGIKKRQEITAKLKATRPTNM